MKPLLEVKNIEKYYGNKGNITKAVDNLSLTVNQGEFVGVMGASGSGKTTLLNCISTIDTITSGYIAIDGLEVSELSGKALAKYRREALGFIFQEYNLLETLTGFENIALALTIQKVNAKIIHEKVSLIAAVLGIEGIMGKYPYQMSGGERQRVAAARAVVSEPKLILADEPTGALDSKSARHLMETLQKLNDSMNATIMMVTHDAHTASYADRIIFLQDGKVFSTLHKGGDNQAVFFKRILDVVTLIGGESAYVS